LTRSRCTTQLRSRSLSSGAGSNSPSLTAAMVEEHAGRVKDF
jgi:hypothetical protein